MTRQNLLFLLLSLFFVGGCVPEEMPPDASVVVEPVTTRDVYGHPDLNGIWQALGSAHWNIEAHAARAGPIAELAALGAIPAGLSIIEGDGRRVSAPWCAGRPRPEAS